MAFISLKGRLPKLAILIVLIILDLSESGCRHDRLELPIAYELPIIYYGCSLKNFETTVIRDKIGLDTIFSPELINQIPDLQNIDFSKYDLLVGADVYTHGINHLDFKFEKLNSKEYTFTIQVYYLITLPAGNFWYGIIVDKLPVEATVNFVIKKLG